MVVVEFGGFSDSEVLRVEDGGGAGAEGFRVGQPCESSNLQPPRSMRHGWPWIQ
jgi:hypothetical protein